MLWETCQFWLVFPQQGMGRSGESTSFTLRFENAGIYSYSVYYIHSIKEILYDGTTAKLNENIIYYY